MKWRKLGLVFSATGQFEWMHSHAANPVASQMAGTRYRIYFSTRDRQNRSHIAFVEIDLTDPSRILRISDHPLLSPGPDGAFDDSGISMGCLTRVGSEIRLYYVGWNLGVTVPWRNSIGVAISNNGGLSFTKLGRAPIMDRHNVDPYSLSYPWLLGEEGRWKMWYGSNLTWGRDEASMNHVIKFASSHDGIHWTRPGTVCIDLIPPGEFAISRPTVLQDGEVLRMWYCHRGDSYRIGYAESTDGMRWERKDHLAGIEPSDQGWDSDSVAYPSVFRHNQDLFLLYNGNRYGATGFGLAMLESRNEQSTVSLDPEGSTR